MNNIFRGIIGVIFLIMSIIVFIILTDLKDIDQVRYLIMFYSFLILANIYISSIRNKE